MELVAYGKLNLSLAVIGRRPDGYHEIDSIVQTIDLADRIEIEWAETGIEVENDLGPFRGPDLAERAAGALMMEKGIDAGVRIRIRKGIPIGAGLGGGSSDAAAVLAGLDRMSASAAAPERLLSLAARIGSDVPLFLRGGRLRVRGRGEAIEPLPAGPPETYVLLIPSVACETADVYRQWDAAPIGKRALGPTGEIGRNDLAHAACSLHPTLSACADAVRSVGADSAGMSGSGSTFYAVFRDAVAADRAATALRRRFPEADVRICRGTACGWREGGGVR